MDWSQTPLGPVASWPHSLRTVVGLCLSSRYPISIFWGQELIQLYNDAYRPILGATKHPRALGQPGRVTWPEIWSFIGPMFADVVERGISHAGDDTLFVLDRNGYAEETYFNFSYDPIRDDDGRVGGVFVACQETTERVLGERRLQTLRDVAELASTATTDAEVCRLIAEVLERNPADVPFALVYLLDGPAERACLMAASHLHRGDGSVPEAFGMGDDSAGPWAHVLSERLSTPAIDPFPLPAALPLADLPRDLSLPSEAIALTLSRPGDSRPAGVLVVGRNPRRALDERHRSFLTLLTRNASAAIANARAHEAERERAEALAELDRAKTTFFSNVSHEFRTPLTLMLGPLEDVLTESAAVLPSGVRQSLESAHRNSLRLLKLVNSLLDFARIEVGRAEAAYEPLELGGLTTELSSVFRSAVERAGLELVVDCPAMPELVHVDREMYEKVVLNLLSNALKFTFEGKISVCLRWRGEDVVLEVRDTGIGIAATELPQLFKRFHRVAGARGRTQEGSGIGLALTQELVRLHGGSIRVESEPGVGSSFQATFRTGVAHLPHDRIGAERKLASTAVNPSIFVDEALRWLPDETPLILTGELYASVPPPDPATPRALIVVVDDNADMREYLGRILSQRWDVRTASDGAAALEIVRRQTPELVLSDVMMPGLDGFQLLRELRQNDRTRHVPVVLLSARAGEEARVEGLNAGADDYLIKPFSARELLARVNSQLNLARARREAELQKERLHSLLMQAPTPIMILRGPDYIIELANRLTCQVWGRRQENIIGRRLFDALPELEDQVFKQLLDGAMRTGNPYTGRETPAKVDRRGDGQPDTIFFNFVCEPLREVDGRIDGVLILAFDVTDEVLARQNIDQLRAEAQEANRTKDEFLAMLGHELRNPLSPIVTALQLMKLRGGASGPFERERQLIERQVGHLTRLVDDLLDVSRIARGKLDLKKQPIDIGSVVAKAIEIASPLFELRRHTLTVTVPEGPLFMNGDEHRLTQVVANLLTNAARYTEPGGTIEVRVHRQGNDAIVSVRDSGVGIAPELLPRIFELFWQGGRAQGRSEGGLGLGLAIVRNLVQMHGGSVVAHSDGVGKGSEFTVRLPALEGARATAPRPIERAVSESANAARVLVVDDNVDAAEMLADGLTALGYNVRIAHDGPSALTAAREFAPAFGVLDIGLPVMDGYELAGRLRELLGPGISLFAVTGYGQQRDRERSRDAGFLDHLVKPFDIQFLADKLTGARAAPRNAL